MLLRPEPRALQTNLLAVKSDRQMLYPLHGLRGSNLAKTRAIQTATSRVEGEVLRTTITEAPEVRPVELPDLDKTAVNNPVAPSSLSSTSEDTTDQTYAAPIEVWEGEVRSVDVERQVMQVRLSPKLSKAEQHTGEIELEWVAEQDKHLVRPGAVFYWTLYKETRRGTVVNAQSLSFRRLPNWSRHQLKRIREDAQKLFKNAKQARQLP